MTSYTSLTASICFSSLNYNFEVLQIPRKTNMAKFFTVTAHFLVPTSVLVSSLLLWLNMTEAREWRVYWAYGSSEVRVHQVREAWQEAARAKSWVLTSFFKQAQESECTPGNVMGLWALIAACSSDLCFLQQGHTSKTSSDSTTN